MRKSGGVIFWNFFSFPFYLRKITCYFKGKRRCWNLGVEFWKNFFLPVLFGKVFTSCFIWEKLFAISKGKWGAEIWGVEFWKKIFFLFYLRKFFLSVLFEKKFLSCFIWENFFLLFYLRKFTWCIKGKKGVRKFGGGKFEGGIFGGVKCLLKKKIVKHKIERRFR